MKSISQIMLTATILVMLISGCIAAGDITQELTEKQKKAVKQAIQEKIKVARAKEARETPKWVNELAERIREHYYKISSGFEKDQVWGFMGDEKTSERFYTRLKTFGGFEKAPGWSEARQAEAIKYWQSWQSAKTGRFRNPEDPNKSCNEKYVVGILGLLGAERLYRWTMTSETGKIETADFLKRSKADKNWAEGGWAIGSHTGHMARETFFAINEGQTELIEDLEEGIANILAHQDANSGLWGPETAPLSWRIGGTLKVVGRFYWWMELKVPHSQRLADTLIRHQQNGDWLRGANKYGMVVARNACEMIAYCIESSDYRREDLLEALESNVNDLRRWAKGAQTPYALEYCLGIAADYLHWQDCPFPNPLTADREEARNYYYKIVRQGEGKVKVVKKRDSELVWNRLGGCCGSKASCGKRAKR